MCKSSIDLLKLQILGSLYHNIVLKILFDTLHLTKPLSIPGHYILNYTLQDHHISIRK